MAARLESLWNYWYDSASLKHGDSADENDEKRIKLKNIRKGKPNVFR